MRVPGPRGAARARVGRGARGYPPDVHVVSIGSVNADFHLRVERLPAPGETIAGAVLRREPGGKAANRAVVARRLGAGATLVCCVGDDDLADQALSGPRAEGVRVRCARATQARTGTSAITVDAEGTKTIVLADGANADWPAGGHDAARDAVAGAPAPAVLALDLEIPAAVARAGLEAAVARDAPVVIDATSADRAAALPSLAGHVTANAHEAAALAGAPVDDVAGAAGAGRELLARGAERAYVRLGAVGTVVVDADGTRLVEHAPRSRVVDTTGVGDGFTGGLAVAVCAGDAEPCLRAEAVAAHAISGIGSQSPYPPGDAVERMLRGGQVPPARRLPDL